MALEELIKERQTFLYKEKMIGDYEDTTIVSPILKKVDKKSKKSRDVRHLPPYFYDRYKIFDDHNNKECITSFSQIGMLDPFP